MSLVEILQYLFVIFSCVAAWGLGGLLATYRLRFTSRTKLTAEEIHAHGKEVRKSALLVIVGSVIGIITGLAIVNHIIVGIGCLLLMVGLSGFTMTGPMRDDDSVEKLSGLIEAAKVRMTAMFVIGGVFAIGTGWFIL